MPRNELLCPKCEYSHPKMMPAQDGRFTFWARNWSFLFIVEIWLGGRIGWGQLLDISVLSVQIASSFPLLGELFHLCLLWALLHMASEFFNPVCSVSLFPIIYWQKCLVFICCIISFAPQCLLDTSEIFPLCLLDLRCCPNSISVLVMHLIPFKPGIFQRRLLWKAFRHLFGGVPAPASIW